MTSWNDEDIAGLIGNVGTFQPGEKLSLDFEILELLGSGSQSEVYHVRNTLDNREYVAKYFTRNNDDIKYEISVFQALQELPQSSALVLAHPTIRHDKQSVLILEYIDGPTLDSKLEDSRFSVRRASQIACKILTGLQVLHKSGIIHRDIKPGNIKLAKTGAVIFDFGIAARINDKSAPDYYTQGFAPPERDITATWDTYSTGVLFHLMVTGRIPIWGSGHNQPIDARDRLILHDEFNFHPWAKAFIRRALAFNPADRYPDADSMIFDLSNYSRKALLTIDALKQWSKNHFFHATFLLMILILAIAGPIYLNLRLNAQHKRNISELSEQYENEINQLNDVVHSQQETIDSLISKLAKNILSEFQDLMVLYSFNLDHAIQICDQFPEKHLHLISTSEKEAINISTREKEAINKNVHEKKQSLHALRQRTRDTTEGLPIRIENIILEAPETTQEIWLWIDFEKPGSATKFSQKIKLIKDDSGRYSSPSDLQLDIDHWTQETNITISIKDTGSSWKDWLPFRASPKDLVDPFEGDLYALQPKAEKWENGGWISWPSENYRLRLDGYFR